MSTALLVIDVQNDFYAGGALAAAGTETLLAPLNDAIHAGHTRGIPCIFSRDWHPAAHRSFAAQGGPWPAHCIGNSRGARFVDGLTVPAGSHVVDKGVEADDTSYSMFDRTNLAGYLRSSAIGTVAVCGIATEYCVLETVRDGVQLGWEVAVLVDLIRPVNAHAGDGDRALIEMHRLGATLITGAAWLETLDSTRR